MMAPAYCLEPISRLQPREGERNLTASLTELRRQTVKLGDAHTTRILVRTLTRRERAREKKERNT